MLMQVNQWQQFQNWQRQQQQGVLKHTTTTVNAGQLLHGPGGLFNTPGLENPIMSTVVAPQGLGPLLPAFPTLATYPYYGYLTEIVSGGEDEPDEVCDPAPTGQIKNGTLSTQFGRVQASTKTIDLGQIVQIINNSDRTDLMLAGSLLNPQEGGVSYPGNVNEGNVIENTIKTEMVASCFMMGMKIGRMLWNGDPSNATAGEGYKPFRGISSLVKTGYVDAETNNAVAALDSLIVDGGWNTIGPGGTYDFASKLRAVMHYLEDLARKTVGSAEFVIVMRPEMWRMISDLYVLQYVNELVAAVDDTTAARWNLDAASITERRDALKEAHMLPVGGKLYMVVEDDGIPQLTNADDGNIPVGQFSSTIYVLPVTVAGSLPVLYWEYLDWNRAMQLLAQVAGLNEQVFWTDGGRFAWTFSRTNMCIKLQARVEPRVILRAPQLAARIDDLIVNPDIDVRSAYIGDSGYVGGGETTRTGQVPNF